MLNKTWKQAQQHNTWEPESELESLVQERSKIFKALAASMTLHISRHISTSTIWSRYTFSWDQIRYPSSLIFLLHGLDLESIVILYWSIQWILEQTYSLTWWSSLSATSDWDAACSKNHSSLFINSVFLLCPSTTFNYRNRKKHPVPALFSLLAPLPPPPPTAQSRRWRQHHTHAAPPVVLFLHVICSRDSTGSQVGDLVAASEENTAFITLTIRESSISPSSSPTSCLSWYYGYYVLLGCYVLWSMVYTIVIKCIHIIRTHVDWACFLQRVQVG